MVTTLVALPNPPLLYGTAWKEQATADCVLAALQAGYRGIDTANQRKHYHEAAVGQALATAYQRGWLTRSDVFLQTKFTPHGGQDHRLPYDPRAPLDQQVQQSLASSLEHLQTDHIDSYVLHGPTYTVGLSQDDWDIWQAMIQLPDTGQVGALGASNVTLEQLSALCEIAGTNPAFVQNRCFARTYWDRDVRHYCRQQGIVYQGFSLLTANVHEIGSDPIQRIAARRNKTPAQIVFRFALHVGMLPLTGTTDPVHMRQDLEATEFELDEDEVRIIEEIAARR